MGRMTTNIAAIGASGHYVTLAGGDLYRMARDAYGDAAEWATIARVNGLTDPVIEGVTTLLVPPLSGDTQGVLTDLRQAPVNTVNQLAATSVAGQWLNLQDWDNAVLTGVI